MGIVDTNSSKVWLIDLDGVVWLAGEPIEGAGQAADAIRMSGKSVIFVTNNSGPSKETLISRLRNAGIEAGRQDVITAADAAASLLERGEDVYLWGEDGLLEAVEAKGAHIVEDPERAATIVIGWSTHFDFDQLSRVSGAISNGARYIGANEDPTHPTPHGLLPGTGALLAAVSAASHTQPIVAGKPHDPMVRLVQSQAIGGLELVIGDRPSTDGLFAAKLGLPFALVGSDATAKEGDREGVNPQYRAGSLLEIVKLILGDA
jgi:4-nitrophenyl phosphatase